MASANSSESNSAISPEANEEMEKYGITRVPVDYFHYKEYRYTNSKDAIAQAERQQSKNGSSPASNSDDIEEMAKYGITRVPVDYFHYKEYRYTNLNDAIAEAERQQHSD
jgi:hypothetical protein